MSDLGPSPRGRACRPCRTVPEIASSSWPSCWPTWHVPTPPTASRSACAPRRPGDPTVALLDAWATVADVIAFYQDRIANEGYLRTAAQPGSLLALAQLVGHRPRPGLAASVWLAYSLHPDPADTAVVLPARAAGPVGARDRRTAPDLRNHRGARGPPELEYPRRAHHQPGHRAAGRTLGADQPGLPGRDDRPGGQRRDPPLRRRAPRRRRCWCRRSAWTWPARSPP